MHYQRKLKLFMTPHGPSFMKPQANQSPGWSCLSLNEWGSQGNTRGRKILIKNGGPTLLPESCVVLSCGCLINRAQEGLILHVNRAMTNIIYDSVFAKYWGNGTAWQGRRTVRRLLFVLNRMKPNSIFSWFTWRNNPTKMYLCWYNLSNRWTMNSHSK